MKSSATSRTGLRDRPGFMRRSVFVHGDSFLEISRALISIPPCRVENGPHLRRQSIRSERLRDECGAGIDGAAMHDAALRVAGHVEDPHPGRSGASFSYSSWPFIAGMTTSVSIKAIGPSYARLRSRAALP